MSRSAGFLKVEGGACAGLYKLVHQLCKTYTIEGELKLDKGDRNHQISHLAEA